jgi:asparaginyl-tRNA synthetase
MHGGFGEIITGGQRASDYAFLRSRIEAQGLSLEDFAWYLDLRRFGSVPHSGFGMGIERMLRWICGIHRIREAIPFARTPSRCRP